MSEKPGTQVLEDLLATIESKLGINDVSGIVPANEDTGGQAVGGTGQKTGGQAARGTTDAVGGRDDAISAVLNEEPRTSVVVSLRDAPAVEAFRQALSDGLIRVDTANRLLRLINEIIVRMVP